MSEGTNIYLATIEKTGKKVLVWNGTYNLEQASMWWYEINDERDWSDDKFSDFELLSTHQLQLKLAEISQALATQRAEIAEKVRGLRVHYGTYEGDTVSFQEVLAIIEGEK